MEAVILLLLILCFYPREVSPLIPELLDERKNSTNCFHPLKLELKMCRFQHYYCNVAKNTS